MAADYSNLTYDELIFLAKDTEISDDIAIAALEHAEKRSDDRDRILAQIESEGQPVDEDSFLTGLAQVGGDILSELPSKVIGGISGIRSLMSSDGGQAAEDVEKTKEAVKNFFPRIEGRTAREISEIPGELLESSPEFIQEGVEFVGDKAKMLGAGIDAASNVLAEEGQPLKATALQTTKAIPDALALVAGGMGVAQAVSKAGGANMFKTQSKTKQRIGKLLEDGIADVETARFELDGDKVGPDSGAQLPAIPDDFETVPFIDAAESLQETIRIGAPRVKRDKEAIASIKQGFDDGVIAMVKGASGTDKQKMLKMVEIKERAKKNRREEAKNRPSDVAGDTVMERYNFVRSRNREAGKSLDGIAKDLKGQNVEFTDTIDNFILELDDTLGVTIGPDLKPNFDGAIIEGVEGAENAVKKLVSRMAKNPNQIDAFELHRLKKFIDEQVSFGKQKEGLGGKTESVMKGLRKNIDGVLDQNFPEYDQVNTVYAETITALDELQDATGKKLDFSGDNANKAVGTPLRRLMGNAQSRVNLMDAINGLERTARKHGAEFDDDLFTQILFADELDSRLGTSARTSFSGEVERGTRRGFQAAAQGKAGFTQAAIDIGADQAAKLRGINDEAAIKSIKTLLRK